MSKRLQVVVDEAELERYDNAARASGLTLSQWVRQTLAGAERRTATGDVDAKLAAVRTAAAHEFPTADIGQMLWEIDAGR